MLKCPENIHDVMCVVNLNKLGTQEFAHFSCVPQLKLNIPACVFLYPKIFYSLISGIFPIYRIYTNQKAVIGTLLFQKFSRTLHSGNK